MQGMSRYMGCEPLITSGIQWHGEAHHGGYVTCSNTIIVYGDPTNQLARAMGN